MEDNATNMFFGKIDFLVTDNTKKYECRQIMNLLYGLVLVPAFKYCILYNAKEVLMVKNSRKKSVV